MGWYWFSGFCFIFSILGAYKSIEKSSIEKNKIQHRVEILEIQMDLVISEIGKLNREKK